MDKKQWTASLMTDKMKKAMPVLSYPALRFTGYCVEDVVKNGAAQAQCILTAAEKCPSAAAVSFMDLSVEAECFGSDIVFGRDSIPAVTGSIAGDEQSIDNLKIPAVFTKRVPQVIECIKEVKEKLHDRPFFAGATGPYSLAGRLADVTQIMYMCYDYPEKVHTLLEKCTAFSLEYIEEMKKAGADGVIIAEPLAGMISPDMEREFSAPYIKILCDKLRDSGFAIIYHNCGNNVNLMTESLSALPCDGFHFGNACDMQKMLASMPSDKLIFGNIDPVKYFTEGNAEEMTAAVNALLSSCAQYNNFVLSSGCDIPHRAKWDNIDAFFGAYKEYYENREV